MNKPLLAIALLCVTCAVTAKEDSNLDNAKEQVLGLLDMLESRNQLLESTLSGTNLTQDDKAEKSRSDERDSSEKAVFTQKINAYIDGVRDPFALTREIFSANQAPEQHSDGGSTFNRDGVVYTLPRLALKGVIHKAKKQNPIALLEVSGYGTHLVRVGDELGFNPSEPKQVLKIKKISRLNVIVEVGTLGDLIVVR